MKRREFIGLFGGTAATWPLVARGQQGDRVRRIGFLAGTRPGQLEEMSAFREELTKLGWTDGHNLRIDEFHPIGSSDRAIYAAKLVELGPEAIVAAGGADTLALGDKTSTIPIITIGAGDVFGRLVKDIAHPERNVTGVSSLFSSFGGKWLELLKEAVPRLENVAYVRAPAEYTNFCPSIAEASHPLAVQATDITYGNGVDLVHRIDEFAATPNAGLIVPPASFSANEEAIVALAAQHRLPTVVGNLPKAGALICYGPDYVDLFRGGARFVDRILRGAKVSELPVEFPTKFELVINLKTARGLGLDLPAALLTRADEVIE
jgi:putative ABC transport system substrate-binding protein